MKAENSSKTWEDILLIRRTLLGDQSAFEKLVKKYRPAICTLVKSYVKNAADAEDLTQEVFIKAYQNIGCLKNLERFPLWLRRIAHNHCKNWLRRREERYISFEEIKAPGSEYTTPYSPGTPFSLADMTLSGRSPSAITPEEMALKQELREIVWQAINSLLEIDRKLLEERYMEDVSLKQLQKKYGLSYYAVAHRLQRAKEKVRDIVKKALMGFGALPGREILGKLLLGGIEVVKLSLKTKLVTVGVAVMLGLGGASVWFWHSNEAPQKDSVIQGEVSGKKSESAKTTSRVQIPKPKPEAAQKQPTKSSQSGQEDKISDEEWEQFEKWLADLEQSDEQPAEEADSSQSKHDETASLALSEEAKAKYQELKGIFVQMKENQDEMYSTRDEWRHWLETETIPSNEIPPNADKRAIRMQALKFLEGEYPILEKMKRIKEEWVATAEQINQIVPGALVTEEVDMDKPWGHTRYSINREHIESLLGKMPSEIENIFPSGMAFKLTTEEQLEDARRLIEQMREVAKK